MASNPDSSIAQVLDRKGSVVGAAFLASEGYLLTCAHVIAEALGFSSDTVSPPTDTITVNFPLVLGSSNYLTKVVCWHPIAGGGGVNAHEDIAALQLLPNDHLDPIKPSEVVIADNAWKHRFRALGFPRGYDQGLWARGEILGKQGAGWVQIEAIKDPGYFVSQGFSGTPIWDEHLKSIVGMVVGAANDPERRVAFMIPTEMLLKACPDIANDAVRRISEAETSDSSDSEDNGASFQRSLVKLGRPAFVFKRESLMTQALRVLQDNSSNVLFVKGLPGSGKVVLISELALALEDEFPYAFTIKFEGPTTFEPAYFVEELNDFLLSIGRGIDPKNLGEQTIHNALSTLITQLGDLRVLILLIGADLFPPDLLDFFIRGLTFYPQIRVVGTGIQRPNIQVQANSLDVLPLSDPECVALAEEYSRIFDLHIDSDQLLQKVPKAIRSNPQALITLLGEVRDVPFDLLLEGAVASNTSPVQLVGEIIARLDAAERAALAQIEVLSEINIYEAIKILGVSVSISLPQMISRLVSKSLILRSENSYSPPAVVIEALKTVAAEARRDSTIALGESSIVSIAGLKDDDTNLRALAVLSVRIMMHLAEHARWQMIMTTVSEEYLELLTMRGYWKEYLATLRLGIRAAGNLNDMSSQFRMRCRLARKLLQMGEQSEAHVLLSDIAKYSGAEAGSLDEADVHSHRALLYNMDGDAPAALRELSESRTIRERLGDKIGLAITENIEGNTYLQLREFPGARRAYEVALEHFGEQKSRYVVDAEMNLGLCLDRQGHSGDALVHLKTARDLCVELEYDAILPLVLYHLARLTEVVGDLNEAAKIARESSERAQTIDRRLVFESRMLATRLQLLAEKTQ